MNETILDLLEEDNIRLKQSGNRWVATCPFHEGDRDPSFTVYPTGTYFCFGCSAKGDALAWLLDYRKLTVPKALEFLGRDYQPRTRAQVIKIRDVAKAYPYLSKVADIYHQNLLQQKGAIQYLYSRGLTLETITKYKIGYTDGGVTIADNDYEYEIAMDVGLIHEKGYEILAHRITIPNLVGKYCDFIMGRTIKNVKPKYLGIQTPKPVHGLYEQRSQNTLFLVEGHFDWLVLRQWGYPAVAIGGQWLTRANRDLLNTRKVIIVPDNDSEGEKAAERHMSELDEATLLDYTEFGVKDIGELALESNSEEKFAALVRKQLPWYSTNTSQTRSMPYSPTSGATILSA